MKALRLIDRWFEESVITVFMGYFVFATIFQVVARLVLHVPAAWTEETSRYAFIWMTFVGSAVAVKQFRHVRVDLLDTYVKNPKVKAVLFWICYLAFLVFALVMAKIGVDICRTLLRRPQVMPVMGLSMIYVYSALPVGMALTVLRLLQVLWRKMRGADVHASDAAGGKVEGTA